MIPDDNAQHGVPGEGKGRRDEVGRTGIWPASGPLPPGRDVPIVGQDELTHGSHERAATEIPGGASAFETDPVCGSRINRTSAEHRDFNGHAYYFDSLECLRRFDEAPGRFATMPDRRRAEGG